MVQENGTAAAPGGAPAIARSLARLAPAVAALAIAHLLLSVAAWRDGYAPLAPATWARWDSWQYLDVAQHGYHVAPCADEPGAFCGDTGWLPGFAYAVRALTWVRIPPVAAGLGVALAFELALLALVWTRWLGAAVAARPLLTLLAVAVAVGIVYQHAVFPISMVAFFAALQADRVAARRWTAAALAGAAAAFSYSTAFFLAPVAGATILLDRELPWRSRLAPAAAVAAATFGGFVAVLAIQQVTVGAWNAFFLVQARYGHALQSPLATIATYLSAPDSGDGVLDSIREHVVASCAFVALVIASAAISARRGGSALDRWAALYAFAFFLVPFAFGPAVNPVRSVSLLSPAAVTLRWLPRPVLAAWLVISAWIVYRMAALYFARTIV